MTNDELYKSVKKVIDKDIRRMIQADGGRIELNRVDEDGNVYVTLGGACKGCPAVSVTLRSGVESILKMKIKEVKSVKLSDYSSGSF